MDDQRTIRVLVHQGGPIGAPLSLSALDRISAALDEEPADLVVLSELSLSPYFPTTHEPAGGSLTRVDGPEIRAAEALATRHRVLLVLPFAEAGARGVAYNSAALVGPDGLVPGRMVSGRRAGADVLAYRKVHLSENAGATPGVHEKFHFTAGDGFLVWPTPLGVIAPLICYDRSFPESWRAVAASGAEIVVLPMATSRPERVRMLEAELTVAAVQNGVFVVAACKAGSETIHDATVGYSGGSMVVAPDGSIVARAAAGDPDVLLRAVVDRQALEDYPRTFHYSRDMRPDAYLVPGAPWPVSPKEGSDA